MEYEYLHRSIAYCPSERIIVKSSLYPLSFCVDVVGTVRLEKRGKKGWGVTGSHRVFQDSCDDGTTRYTVQIEIARPKTQIVNSSGHLWFDDIIHFLLFRITNEIRRIKGEEYKCGNWIACYFRFYKSSLFNNNTLPMANNVRIYSNSWLKLTNN